MPRGVRLNPQHDERTRAKIQTSQIINRLQSFINGECKLSAPQVTAALGLLKKTTPDLSQTDVNHTVKRDATDYSREELVAFLRNASNGSNGAAETEGRGAEPDSVH
jgi:hypothetical protein